LALASLEPEVGASPCAYGLSLYKSAPRDR